MWIDLKGNKITSLEPDTHSIIYLILFKDNTRYIGKKQVFNTKTLPILKKGGKRKGHIKFVNKNKNHKRITLEVVRVESNWRDYIGSFDKSKFVNNDVEKKIIIGYAKSKAEATFMEVQALMKFDVLFGSKYRNDNISGKWFSNQFPVNCIIEPREAESLISQKNGCEKEKKNGKSNSIGRKRQ